MSIDPSGAFEIDETTGVDGATITLRGELDIASAHRVGEALRRNLDTGRRLVVDLGDVTFIDSTGLAAIVTSPASDAERARLVLRSSRHQQPQRLLSLTNVSELFTVEPEA